MTVLRDSPFPSICCGTQFLAMEQARNFYVYEHRRLSDGAVFYVGKGQSQRAWARTGRNAYWRNTVAKHGLIIEVLEDASGLTEQEAHRIERELIAHHRYHGAPLTNLTDGGEGASGYRHTQEERQRRSERQRGKPKPWQAGEKNPNFGGKHSVRGERHHLSGQGHHWRGERNPNFGQGHRQHGEKNPNYSPEFLLFENVETSELHRLTRTQAREQLGITQQGVCDLVHDRQKTSRGFRLIRGEP